MPKKRTLSKPQAGLRNLLGELRGLIQQARQQAHRAVDLVQVQTCWKVGRHIVEFEQGGKERAEYGTGLLPRIAETLTAEFGRGFDASNLRYMRLFFQAFPIRGALRHELSCLPASGMPRKPPRKTGARGNSSAKSARSTMSGCS